jgi:hypothetical protein
MLTDGENCENDEHASTFTIFAIDFSRNCGDWRLQKTKMAIFAIFNHLGMFALRLNSAVVPY